MALQTDLPPVGHDDNIELESMSGDSVGSSGYMTPPERTSTPNAPVYQNPLAFARLPLPVMVLCQLTSILASTISFPSKQSIINCTKFAALFIVALVVVPPTFSAMSDGRKSARLAEWGAMVTYRQACLVSIRIY